MTAIPFTARYVAPGNTLSAIILRSRFPTSTNASTASRATLTWIAPKTVRSTRGSLRRRESARQNARRPRAARREPKIPYTRLARPTAGPRQITTTRPIELREVQGISRRRRKGQKPTTGIPPRFPPFPENEPAPPRWRTVPRRPTIPPRPASTRVTTSLQSLWTCIGGPSSLRSTSTATR